MADRKWISNELMYWEKKEWDEAFQGCTNEIEDFRNLSGVEQMEKMVAWLMKKYPVEREQIEKQKERLGVH